MKPWDHPHTTPGVTVAPLLLVTGVGECSGGGGPGQGGVVRSSKYLFRVALDLIIDDSGNRRKLCVTGRDVSGKGQLQKSQLRGKCGMRPSVGRAEQISLRPQFLSCSLHSRNQGGHDWRSRSAG